MTGAIRWGELRSWRDAQEAVTARSWELLATGDWSWVYREPGADQAVRITPFDPAFGLFAKFCAANAGNLHLPRIDLHASHADGGSTTVMELLQPVTPQAAEAWLELIKTDNTPELARLRHSLDAFDPGDDVPLFAGVDYNPANVMRRVSDGSLVFTDAFWIEGRKLLKLISDRPAAALDHYPRASLSDWAHLPCMDAATTSLILRQLDSTLEGEA